MDRSLDVLTNLVNSVMRAADREHLGLLADARKRLEAERNRLAGTRYETLVIELQRKLSDDDIQRKKTRRAADAQRRLDEARIQLQAAEARRAAELYAVARVSFLQIERNYGDTPAGAQVKSEQLVRKIDEALAGLRAEADWVAKVIRTARNYEINGDFQRAITEITQDRDYTRYKNNPTIVEKLADLRRRMRPGE